MSKLSRLITNNNKLKTKITSSLKQGGSISVKDDYLLVPSGNISINSETLNTPINSETQQKTTLIDDSIVKGGYHVLSTIEQRDAILCCYRKQGMKVVVVGTDFSFKEYVLMSPNCDTNVWEEIRVNVDIDESEVSLIEDYSELGTDIQSQMELNTVLKNLLLQLQQDIQDVEVPTKTSDLQNDGENGSEPFITALDIPEIPQQVKSDWNAVTGPAEILNKPSIPSPQVNSDWNSTTGVSEILNKPRIPESTADLQNNGEDGINPFITAQDIPAPIPQVNADWNATSGVAQILNKPTIPAPVDVSTKAETDASNLTPTNVISWRDALDIYSKSQVDGFVSTLDGKITIEKNRNDTQDGQITDLYIAQTKFIVTSSITNETLSTDGGLKQNNRNNLIANGVNAINITLTATAETKFQAIYHKLGSGTITFIAGAGVTLVLIDGTAKMEGTAELQTAAVHRDGNKYYIQISNR